MTESDHKYILKEVEHRDKFDYKKIINHDGDKE